MTKIITPARVAEFDRWAKARAGNDYWYGGHFTADPDDSTDCSGLVTSTGAFFQGMNPYIRYGSTESFRLNYAIIAQLGFRRGAGGPEHFFKVGLQHGGGGEFSHTACTVNGVNWESRGDGVYYGPKARGWNNSLFHDFWHWDGVIGKPVAPVNKIDEAAKLAAKWIGNRKTTGERPTPDGRGRYAEFANAHIYWSPTTGAFPIPHAGLFEAFAAHGYETKLGYPTLPHKVLKDGGVQAFERGVLYRKNGSARGCVVTGVIGRRWMTEGAENGGLGWPTTDEYVEGSGRRQDFERGSLTWDPSGAVKIVSGK